MREILFRGKRIDNGEWVEGYYFERKDTKGNIIESVIIVDAYGQITSGQRYMRSNLNNECFYVGFKTVGQFTGLTDKNGKKIFEGDICRVCLDPGIRMGNVIWDGEIASYNIPFNNGKCVLPLDIWIAKNKVGDKVWIEVIGNIHDNPELLEGE